jgi:hypothetical protein
MNVAVIVARKWPHQPVRMQLLQTQRITRRGG